MTQDITPILTPILNLLRSRAVMAAFLTLIARILADYSNLTPGVQEAIVLLGLAVIGKMAAEDVAYKLGNGVLRPAVPAAGMVVNNIGQTEGAVADTGTVKVTREETFPAGGLPNDPSVGVAAGLRGVVSTNANDPDATG